MCELFRHLDSNQIHDDDEAPFFTFGQKFGGKQIDHILCDGQKPKYIKQPQGKFFHFDQKFPFDKAVCSKQILYIDTYSGI